MAAYFRNRGAALILFGLGAIVAGSTAKADLITVDISDTQPGTSPEIVITNGDPAVTGSGTFSLTFAKKNVTYSSFTIDTTTIPGGTSGAANVPVTGTFTPTSLNLLNFSTTAFGQLGMTAITITSTQTATGSKIDDTTAITGSSGGGNDVLTIGSTATFTQPATTIVDLTSAFDNYASSDRTNSVMLSSTIGSTSTPTLTATAHPLVVPDPATVAALPGSSHYSATNEVQVNGVANGKTFNVEAETDILSTPEPGTLALVIAALPILGVVGWRRAQRGERA